MDHREGADKTGDVRLDFDRRVRLEFHGTKISSNGGLLLFRELDCAFRGIRPPIPTASGHLNRSIRPPVARCVEA